MRSQKNLKLLQDLEAAFPPHDEESEFCEGCTVLEQVQVMLEKAEELAESLDTK